MAKVPLIFSVQISHPPNHNWGKTYHKKKQWQRDIKTEISTCHNPLPRIYAPGISSGFIVQLPHCWGKTLDTHSLQEYNLFLAWLTFSVVLVLGQHGRKVWWNQGTRYMAFRKQHSTECQPETHPPTVVPVSHLQPHPHPKSTVIYEQWQISLLGCIVPHN